MFSGTVNPIPYLSEPVPNQQSTHAQPHVDARVDPEPDVGRSEPQHRVRRRRSAPSRGLERSGQNSFDDVPVNISQPPADAVVVIGQLLVVKAQQM